MSSCYAFGPTEVEKTCSALVPSAACTDKVFRASDWQATKWLVVSQCRSSAGASRGPPIAFCRHHCSARPMSSWHSCALASSAGQCRDWLISTQSRPRKLPLVCIANCHLQHVVHSTWRETQTLHTRATTTDHLQSSNCHLDQIPCHCRKTRDRQVTSAYSSDGMVHNTRFKRTADYAYRHLRQSLQSCVPKQCCMRHHPHCVLRTNSTRRLTSGQLLFDTVWPRSDQWGFDG